MNSALGAGAGSIINTGSRTAADELPAVKNKNEKINIYDPPKDLYAEGNLTYATHGAVVKELIETLFSPREKLPKTFKSIGDTKDALKDALGTAFMEGLQKDSARLKILREKSTSGHDPKPTGLYVSQDSGPAPSKLVNSPKLIITPGTILDSATKTKKGADPLVGKYGTLPPSYIDEVSMKNVIVGPIEMKEASGTYTITIPTNIGVSGKGAGAGAAAEAGKIVGKLSSTTYKPISEKGDDLYFKGNDTKNAYIEENYEDATAKDNMMKYILVKELGDTLQVLWLKYIINESEKIKKTVINPETKKLEEVEVSKYTIGNSVITTGDTVVWYRCIINKVPVIVTYMGETFLYKAGDNAYMVASFIKTIREETIKQNLSVINTLKAIIKVPKDGGKWITELSWDEAPYRAAVNYLTNIIPKLENFNKDADIYFDNVTTIDAAQNAAARHHFENPFTLNKNNVWKTNNMVTQIFPDVPFYAASFKPLSIISSLAKIREFKQVGGGPKKVVTAVGRATNEEKEAEAKTLTPEKYFAKRLAEWDIPEDVAYEIPEEISKGVSDPTKYVEGNSDTFMSYNQNEAYYFWASNTQDVSVKTKKKSILLNEKPFFLYVFVKENFPQIFTYASMMRKAVKGANSEGLLHYEKKFSFEYVEDDGEDGGILGEMKIVSKTNELTSVKTNYMDLVQEQVAIEAEKFTGGAITRKIRKGIEKDAYKTVYQEIEKEKDAKEAFSKTWEAINLAMQLTDDFPVLLTQELADFFTYLRFILPSETAAVAVSGAGAGSSSTVTSSKGKHGGGPKSFNPVTSKAIDYYELYYTLLVKASYENRNVTEEEFMDEILSREEDIQSRFREEKESQKKFMTQIQQTPQSMKTGTPTAPSKFGKRSFESSGMNIPRLVFGGKRRYKKTQKKKRKSSKRKTRKHKH